MSQRPVFFMQLLPTYALLLSSAVVNSKIIRGLRQRTGYFQAFEGNILTIPF